MPRWSCPPRITTHKVTAILSTDTYRSLSRNPIPAIKCKITIQLQSLHQSQAINIPSSQALCILISSVNPRLTSPMFLSALSRGSPTYNTAKILHPLVGLTPYHITNSSQFVDIIKDLKLSQSDILVSFDVVSLFTNIPTKEACLITKERLQADPAITDRTSLTPEQVHKLLLTCVSSSCFK